jgi:hypothetical protein
VTVTVACHLPVLPEATAPVHMNNKKHQLTCTNVIEGCKSSSIIDSEKTATPINHDNANMHDLVHVHTPPLQAELERF